MAYIGVDGLALGASTRLGCGGSCSCGPCRSARFGESYVPDEPSKEGDEKDEQAKDDKPDDAGDKDAADDERSRRGRRRVPRGRPVRRRRGRRPGGGRLGGYGFAAGPAGFGWGPRFGSAPRFGEPAVSTPPRLAARCYELQLTVPRTYSELEATVEHWIATCVQSRTMVGGAPAHRERSLVRGNPSLAQVWEKIRDAAGRRSRIRAEYIWGANRVESIRFSAPVAVYNFDPGETITVGPADSIARIVDRALELVPDAARHGIPLSAHQVRRITCWLQKLRGTGGDDRFLTGQSMLDYKNSNGRQPLSFSNVRQWLLPQFNIQKRIVASDAAILRTLKSIDEQIIDGRHWVNREFDTQGIAVHRTVQEIRRWIDERERAANSIYTCYCIDSGRC